MFLGLTSEEFDEDGMETTKEHSKSGRCRGKVRVRVENKCVRTSRIGLVSIGMVVGDDASIVVILGDIGGLFGMLKLVREWSKYRIGYE